MRATVVLSHEDSNAIAATEKYGGILLAALMNKPGFTGQLQDGEKVKEIYTEHNNSASSKYSFYLILDTLCFR